MMPRRSTFLASGSARQVLDGLREASYRSAIDLIGDGAIMVVAPHADDETLGCGGLIRAARRSGSAVLIEILTDGAGSHPGSVAFPPPRLAAQRREEARRALVALGLAETAVAFHDQPDGYLGRDVKTTRDLQRRLTERMERGKVTAVFVTSPADPHPDHVAAFTLARQALTQSARKRALYTYPIWAWTEERELALGADAVAAYRLDITRDLEAKRRAVDCYASQLGRLVPDCPEGFRLTPEHLALFIQPAETFVAHAL
jgi:LmbE family N-acetylglucosaminyl deacetylase